MPLVSEVTFQQLVDQIKVESRIKGANNFDITIKALINELLLTETETARYSALLVRGHEIGIADGEGSVNLPADLANICRVWYSRTGEPIRARVLNHKNDFVEESRNGGEPKYYDLAGDQLIIWPYSQVLSTDNLQIDYWKYPQKLENDTDVFPVAKLIPVIKQKAIARLHILEKDMNAADRLNASGTQVAGDQKTSEDNGDA
jgi:hypothetical protein